MMNKELTKIRKKLDLLDNSFLELIVSIFKRNTSSILRISRNPLRYTSSLANIKLPLTRLVFFISRFFKDEQELNMRDKKTKNTDRILFVPFKIFMNIIIIRFNKNASIHYTKTRASRRKI